MKRCYVCGSDIAPTSNACPSCGTAVPLLQVFGRAVGRPRFLFGSVQYAETVMPQERADAKGPPKVKKPIKSAVVMDERVEVPDTADLMKNFDPLIERDEMPPQAAEPSMWRGLAISIDLVLVIVINTIVLRLILAFSHREFGDLLTFSLMPVMFVMLSLSLLYYWLFSSLLGGSLGGIVLKKIKRPTESKAASSQDAVKTS